MNTAVNIHSIVSCLFSRNKVRCVASMLTAEWRGLDGDRA